MKPSERRAMEEAERRKAAPPPAPAPDRPAPVTRRKEPLVEPDPKFCGSCGVRMAGKFCSGCGAMASVDGMHRDPSIGDRVGALEAEVAKGRGIVRLGRGLATALGRDPDNVTDEEVEATTAQVKSSGGVQGLIMRFLKGG